MPVPQTIFDQIKEFEGQGYSPTEILDGLQKSRHQSIADQVKNFRLQRHKDEEILSGLKTSPVEKPPLTREIISGIAATPEVAAGMATGMVAWPISKIAGVAKTITTGAEAGRETERQIAEYFTYMPRGKTAQESLEMVGKVIEKGLWPAHKIAEVAEKMGLVSPEGRYFLETAGELATFGAAGIARGAAKAKPSLPEVYAGRGPVLRESTGPSPITSRALASEERPPSQYFQRGEGTQALPSQTTKRPPPSEVSAMAKTLPDSWSQIKSGYDLGIPKPPSEIVRQPSANIKEILALAEQEKPKFDSALQKISQDVGGEFESRIKSLPSIEEKAGTKTPPLEIRDYLGGRIFDDDPVAIAPKVRADLEAAGYKIVKEENMFTPERRGYRAIHLDVQSPSGLISEIQLHVREAKPWIEKAHKLYEETKAFRKPDLSPEEMARHKALLDEIDDIWRGIDYLYRERIKAKSKEVKERPAIEKPPWDIVARDLVEARTREEIQAQLVRIFGTEEELAAIDEGARASRSAVKRWNLARKYQGDLERAAVDREVENVTAILQRIKSALKREEYPGQEKAPAAPVAKPPEVTPGPPLTPTVEKIVQAARQRAYQIAPDVWQKGAVPAAARVVETPPPGPRPPAPPPRPAEAPKPPIEEPGKVGAGLRAKGAETTVIHSEGRDPVRYMLIEADEIVPSHQPLRGFSKTPSYPEGVQERPYHANKAEQMKIIRNAQAFDPRFLVSDNPDAINGPPIVNESGIVVGGNSRAMTLQYAYENVPDAIRKYWSALRANAERFGIDPARLEKMRKPVLVRMLSEAIEDPKLMARKARLYNQPFTQALDVKAEAVAKGRMVSEETMEMIGRALEEYDSLAEYFRVPSSKELVNRMIKDGVFDPAQVDRMINKATGLLSEEGKRMVERTIRGKIIDDFDLLDALEPATLQKVDKALPALSIIKARGGAWDITDPFKESLRSYLRFRASGFKTIDEYMAQGMMFGRDPAMTDPVIRRLLAAVQEKTPKEFKKTFDNFAAAAARDIKGQAALAFGKPETIEAAFARIFGEVARPGEVPRAPVPGRIPAPVAPPPTAALPLMAREAPPEAVVSGALPRPSKEAGFLAVPSLKGMARSIKEFFDPVASLPEKEKFLGLRYKTLGNLDRVEGIVKRIFDKTEKLSPDMKRDIFRFLDGQIPVTNLPPSVRPMAQNLQTMNNLIGKMLVNRGLLAEETWLAHKNQYVRYLYLKHILGDKPIPVTQSGRMDLSYLKARKDLTPEQKRAIGWIEDVSVAEPFGVSKQLSDIVKFDFYERISENSNWVWQPSIVEIPEIKTYPPGTAPPPKPAGRRPIQAPLMEEAAAPSPQAGLAIPETIVRRQKMGIGQLVEEVEIQRKVARQAPDVPEVQERLRMLEDALKKAQEETGKAPEDFVQMPTGKNWGPLSGAFVRKEIARDIRPLIARIQEPGQLGNLVNTALNVAEGGMTLFKVFKAALNLPTVVRNVVSNFIQLNMSGVPFYEIPGYMAKAGRAMAKNEPIYGQARRHGLFKTNWAEGEIREVIQVVRTMESGSLPDVFGGIQKLAKYYGKIDDFFKLTKLIEQTEKGIPIEKGIIEAQKWGMDYSLAAPAVKYARRFIVPFATYQYKIAPLIAESLKKRPWVIAKYAAIPYIMQEVAKQTLSLTDEDWKKLKAMLPTFIRKENTYAILPWRSPEGNPQWVNLEYFLPWGNFHTLAGGIRRGEIKEVVTDIGMGNPFLDVYSAMKTVKGDAPPKDPFTGREIYNQLDDPSEKALKMAEWLYSKWAPTMLTRYGALGYTARAIEGGKDIYGRAVTPGQAAGRWVGVNIVAPSPMQAIREKRARIMELRGSLARIMKDPSLSGEKKAQALRNFMEQVKQMEVQ
jgi:ppGpp synthetase/RelA/SpoT-type nucleotidyltranferase